MRSQAEAIRKRLVQAVVKTIAQLKLKKPVYCLALNYDCEGNPIMPPMLGIGLDSEKQVRLKKGGKDARLDIWEPEQMSLFAKEKTDKVIFNDKKLQKACDYYNRLLEKKGDNALAHKLLNEIAAELGRMDWIGKLNTTDDFIAYAVDTDLADLQKNLKLSVPAERLKKLKAAKLIWPSVKDYVRAWLKEIDSTALDMKFHELKLRRDPQCPICGDYPTIKELIDCGQFCGIPPGRDST